MSDNLTLELVVPERETQQLAPADLRRDELFKEVSARFPGMIARIALSYEADPGLRRDLVQDIMLAVWLALGTWRGEASLKTFVAAIAQKRCISHVTRRAREPKQEALSVDLPAGGLRPDEAAVRTEMKRHLVDSIQLLPIPQREAIVLCLEGFTYAEIAQVLGISVNAATLRCQRAKEALTSVLGQGR